MRLAGAGINPARRDAPEPAGMARRCTEPRHRPRRDQRVRPPGPGLSRPRRPIGGRIASRTLAYAAATPRTATSNACSGRPALRWDLPEPPVRSSRDSLGHRRFRPRFLPRRAGHRHQNDAGTAGRIRVHARPLIADGKRKTPTTATMLLDTGTAQPAVSANQGRSGISRAGTRMVENMLTARPMVTVEVQQASAIGRSPRDRMRRLFNDHHVRKSPCPLLRATGVLSVRQGDRVVTFRTPQARIRPGASWTPIAGQTTCAGRAFALTGPGL